MEKAVRALEKAAAGKRRDGDGGRRAAVLARGGVTGWWAQGRCGERRGSMAKCGRVGCGVVVESLLENVNIILWLETNGREDTNCYDWAFVVF